MTNRGRARVGASILVRGLVQGVGFRPTVWRLAHELGIAGSVWNDGDGVRIEAWGEPAPVERFVGRLRASAPPLARIDAVERAALAPSPPLGEFVIAASRSTQPTTGVLPDAATCEACRSETRAPLDRRFRYPFTNCTHCGPRFSIVEAVPYDRSRTTMRAFRMCPDCAREYSDPADRRFHAQPNACHACGPTVRLERADGRACSLDSPGPHDALEVVASLLMRGALVAIKGLGGYHLACDATRPEAVERLRARKRRPRKPLALMARDLEVVRLHARVSEREAQLLVDSAAPIVLLAPRLPPDGVRPIAPAVACGMPLLGFMLPHAPLLHLLLARLEGPVVMTSGNLSEAPPCIDDEDARARLGPIADWLLTHDRPIHNRVDDSVVRVMSGTARILRRSRGYAPAPLALPAGFEGAPRVLAMGGELKNTFCLLGSGRAVLSQHIGDLGEAQVFDDYRRQLELAARLFDHRPERVAVDLHPDYASTRLGRERAREGELALDAVQHHHAHVAACLFENGIPLEHPPVLGVALDGMGFAPDGTLWGGEFLLADYAGFQRLGTFKPVALLGGAQAMRQPWRNTLAHILAGMGWQAFRTSFGSLELAAYLESKPLATLEALARTSVRASSTGRLFDAVAAALGLSRDGLGYEGQAALELEALVDPARLADEHPGSAYPFAIARPGAGGLPYVEPLAMWWALLGDLALGMAPSVTSARFHKGLAAVLVRMVRELCEGGTVATTVALSGGVFQNRTLLELVVPALEATGLSVLQHRLVPCNDGGLSLGQAAVAGARFLLDPKRERPTACA